MEFKSWLSDKGDRQVAAMLGVSRYAVRAWRLGTRIPRPEQAKKIAAIEPALTLDAIYSAPESRTKAASA